MSRVNIIQISNILGIEELEIRPGDVTVVRGGNGTGKTSILEAVRAVIGGGHDATLVRKGAEEGRVVLTFGDGVEVTKRVTADGSTLTAKHPEFGAMGAPQGYLNRLADALSFNPVALIRADPKDQAKYLLEAIPMEVDADAIIKIAGGRELPVMPADSDLHALEIIEKVRKHFYDQRTGVNRVASEKTKAASQLRASLPDDVGDPKKVRTTLEEARATLESQQESARAEVREAKEAQADQLQEIDHKLAAEIRKLEAAAEKDREKVRSAAEKRLEKIEEERAGEINDLRKRVATLEERERAVTRAASALELLEETEADAEKFAAESKELTGVLKNIDALRSGLEAEIPIDGVTIEDGELYVEGVPFRRVNKADQVEVAVELAKLRAGDLPLVCVDELECLDAEHIGLFLDSLKESGLQAIVTRVSEGALTIETEEEAPEPAEPAEVPA